MNESQKTPPAPSGPPIRPFPPTDPGQPCVEPVTVEDSAVPVGGKPTIEEVCRNMRRSMGDILTLLALDDLARAEHDATTDRPTVGDLKE
jgi:hypothetical protein